MKNTIANRYALGLFKLAKEHSLIDELLKDCNKILGIYDENKDLQVFLENPKVSKKQKQEIFQESIQESVHQYTYDFILLLIEKGRISHLKGSLKEYIKLSNIEKGLIGVEVTSASNLEKSQIKNLVIQLEKSTGKKIELKNLIDPKIIGGLIIKVGNNVIDGSVRNKISKIRESLLKAQVTEVEVRE